MEVGLWSLSYGSWILEPRLLSLILDYGALVVEPGLLPLILIVSSNEDEL